MSKSENVPTFMMGTKVRDPLVRYSEYKLGAFRVCQYCGVQFTYLGLGRHIQACPDKKPTRVR
jgi:hypothetical protein